MSTMLSAVLSHVAVLSLSALSCAVQAQVVGSFGQSTGTIVTPSGVTTVNRTGNGYTVVSPGGVTTVQSTGMGGYTVVSPRGVTSVTSNGMGGVTAVGPDGVTSVMSNGMGGFTVVGPTGGGGEILPMGNGGLLMIDR